MAAEQKFENRTATADLGMTVDPVQEWRQIFADAWRFNRDYFYDPGIHFSESPAASPPAPPSQGREMSPHSPARKRG